MSAATAIGADRRLHDKKVAPGPERPGVHARLQAALPPCAAICFII